MKLILLMSLTLLFVSCGNPHISSKEPPQKMISPIMPQDETGNCGEQTQEQQQQQQQQQEDYALLQNDEVLKLQKCKENEVTLEKGMNKLSWSFDKPEIKWGTIMPFHSKALFQLLSCKEEVLKEFSLDGTEERIGFSTKNEEVCSVTITLI